jgi:hypothetical protein
MTCRSGVVGIVTLAAALLGCDTITAPATPHPAIVRFVTRPGPGEIGLVDPSLLQGLPIGQDDAIRRAIAGMDPATAGGPIVAWGAQVATGAGIRSGWIVMRGDPRDPDLTAKDFPVELAVIDALTGQPLQWRRPPLRQ